MSEKDERKILLAALAEETTGVLSVAYMYAKNIELYGVDVTKAWNTTTEQGMNYIGIEEYMEHEVAELICLKCFNRVIHVYPTKTLLKELECKCGEIGYLIKTGQTFPDADVDVEKFKYDKRFQNMVRMWSKKEAIEKYKTFVLGQE